MDKIAFTARLTRKADGITHPASFAAAPDLITALIVAHEQFGATHRILTIYPTDHYQRVNWPAHPMQAAAAPPVAP